MELSEGEDTPKPLPETNGDEKPEGRNMYHNKSLFRITLFVWDPPQSTGTKKKANPFPDIEGEESAADFVSKYKRACIGRKTFFKDIQDKVAAEAPSTGQTPSIQV